MPKLGVKSRTLVIQDFNSLFEIESVNLFYFIFVEKKPEKNG